jgi:hypothetical protein
MQYHLVAFAPFAVMAGTALVAGGVSAVIRLRSAKVRYWGIPLALRAVAGPRRSADILYFPAVKSRVVEPVAGEVRDTAAPRLRLVRAGS